MTTSSSYAVILGLIVVVAVLAFVFLGDAVADLISLIGGRVDEETIDQVGRLRPLSTGPHSLAGTPMVTDRDPPEVPWTASHRRHHHPTH